MIAELLADWATYSGQLLGGLGTSLKLTALTLLIGFPAGLLLAIGSGARAKAARTASLVFVEIGRGTRRSCCSRSSTTGCRGCS